MLPQTGGDGFEITYVDPGSDGVVSADAIQSALREDTVLVSVMHVNNETGAIQPVKEIGTALRSREHVFFHCDAVQSLENTDSGPGESHRCAVCQRT